MHSSEVFFAARSLAFSSLIFYALFCCFAFSLITGRFTLALSSILLLRIMVWREVVVGITHSIYDISLLLCLRTRRAFFFIHNCLLCFAFVFHSTLLCFVLFCFVYNIFCYSSFSAFSHECFIFVFWYNHSIGSINNEFNSTYICSHSTHYLFLLLLLTII